MNLIQDDFSTCLGLMFFQHGQFKKTSPWHSMKIQSSFWLFPKMRLLRVKIHDET